MATTHPSDSASVEPHGSVFSSDHVVTSFPRHEVVKLDERTFLQWQQQVRLILASYGLLGFLDGSLSTPSKFVQSSDGTLVANPSAYIFEQQDNLLTSWLLSTISASFLSSFTDVCTACDVWIIANSLFSANTTVKQSHLRHELHSLKKGSLSNRSYVDKIKRLCALLAASETQISEAERTAVLLAVDALLECEARQERSVHNVLLSANLVKGPVQDADGAARGGRPPFRGRGRGFRLRAQCQICNRFGHLAQRCYYRYYRDEPMSNEASVESQGGSVFDWGRGSPFQQGNSQNWLSGQNWSAPPIVNSRPNMGASNVDLCAPHAVNVSLGPTSIVPPRHRPINVGFYSAYGHRSLAELYDDTAGLSIRPNGQVDSGQVFGLHGSVRPRLNDGPSFFGSNVNCVNLDRPLQNNAPSVPWRIKPRARVFDVNSSSYDSSQFVGISRLPEFHASNFSDAAAYDSNFNGIDLYVPLPVGSTSWCPDSGATHHVCQNTSGLNASTPYSGNSSLLMGNGAPTRISSIGHAVLPTSNKLLYLSNVLCVPSIRKNLMSISQFTSDNNVFFEFHSSHCVIKDAQTQEVLLRGRVRDGLYQFTIGHSVSSSKASPKAPSVHNTEVLTSSRNKTVFALWHKRLGHPAATVVTDVPNKFVLLGCIFLSVNLRRLSASFSSRNCAIHLVNRLPTPVLKGRSPYQALHGTEPTYNHLRVFGYCCFPFLRPFLKYKLEFRSQPCTFLGYSSQHKGYYCLTPDGKVVVFCHVVFDKNGFLFSSSPAVSPDNNDSDLRDSVSTYVPVVRSSIAQPPVSAPPLVNTHRMKLAVQAEFDAILANSTWTLVPLPPGRKVIGCKWLFKVKRNPDGIVDRRKARLVAKGC
ncbi:hypothetical protein CXB51_007720 [Gossypium anomalum]|uniref:GAG-pre-integrase domain-containing protein n=1 Tax=Gossypium anomalum TaxID=47600 RepID=A0A8J5YTB3_9ROSI|nr:hypothetical protein CXB51_007720 [Gossypium anomalum]